MKETAMLSAVFELTFHGIKWLQTWDLRKHGRRYRPHWVLNWYVFEYKLSRCNENKLLGLSLKECQTIKSSIS